MEVKGKVIAVMPIQSGEGKNGTWRKQDYVIEYDKTAQYPRKMMFNLWGDNIDNFKIQEGQEIKVLFNIECREYNGRWYNDIRAWKVEQDNGENTDSISAQAAAAPITPEIKSSDELSDLPF